MSAPSPEERLRALLLSKAKAKFKALFGAEYDPSWGSSFLAYLARLRQQDLAARKAAANIRRAPNQARALVREHGVRPGTAPAMVALAEIAGRPNAEMKEWFISDDPILGQKPTYALRIAVIDFFEAVPAMSTAKKGTFGELGRWKKDGYNDRRVLTDSELVAVMICLDPKSVTLFEEDTSGDPDAVANEVLIRERRQMKESRQRRQARLEKKRLDPGYPRDFEIVKRPRTRAERAIEQSKKAVLPSPQGPTTSVTPPAPAENTTSVSPPASPAENTTSVSPPKGS